MPDPNPLISRRAALKCLGFGGAGTLFSLAGGVFTPIDLALAASEGARSSALGKPLFVQFSDRHIGFNNEATPDVVATLNRSIDLVNA
ncbi:MAG: metallophosphoesterase, partial [Gammaproteobacteria bacterium]|nr:metallophosphoesterase [Gammaproteobacteria bacterium]